MARKKKVESTREEYDPNAIYGIELSRFEAELKAKALSKNNHDDAILNILAQFCYEFYVHSGTVEPWRSIKQQIEALRK